MIVQIIFFVSSIVGITGAIYWKVQYDQLRVASGKMLTEMGSMTDSLRSLGSMNDSLRTIGENQTRIDAVQSNQSKIEDALAVIKADLAVSLRRNNEYFSMIEGIIAERDQWKEMFMTQSAGHLRAQSIMSERMTKQTVWIGRVGMAINRLRVAAGLSLIKLAADPTEIEKALVRDYEIMIKALMESAPKDTDWIAERDRLAASEVSNVA